MTRSSLISPSHPLLRTYYRELERYAGQHVEHESALRSAFQNLLADSGRLHGWTLIPEASSKFGDRLIRPDGTLRDRNSLPRGYWEAKDPSDDLAAEIVRKIDRGYPLKNTIFENTQHAVLYQNRDPVRRAELGNPGELADLLNQFYGFVEPDILGFEEAVGEFQERVPDLARGLAQKIAEAHQSNRAFIDAFAAFFKLCQASLNPNIRREAVDEMLVQHLLTERLIRTIFSNPEFTRRNAIAVEVERVIAALVSESFSRDDYLKGLDPFYVAIEAAARTLPDFSEKQHFLNTVYERFFQGYSVRVADTHGIVYTPQPIVDFMCASVAEVLAADFGKRLGDPDIYFLDPCTGTGNFIVNLLHRIPRRDLPRMYREQLFANEVMLLPYYIAALNIEHAYSEITGHYEAFEGLCFVDTLDMAEAKQMSMFAEKNTERVTRQRRTPITVILGNPPYNVGQINENDNNKNRKYPVIDKGVSDTYGRDSIASSVSKLNDPYVKFFRWATDRLEGRDGIVCFVSNNSFFEKIAFDGMRKHLAQDFHRIYHLNLQGNVRKNPKLSGTAYNVFGIQVGVGITLAVRLNRLAEHSIRYHAVPLDMRREKKLDWLAEQPDYRSLPWQQLQPDSRHTWLVPEHADQFSRFLPLAQKKGKGAEGTAGESIFDLYSLGVSTNRDEWIYDFSRFALAEKVERFIETYNGEVDRWKRRRDPKISVDNFVTNDDKRIKWSEALKLNLQREHYADFCAASIRGTVYRPFQKRLLYYDAICIEKPRLFAEIFPTATTEQDNRMICLTGIGSEKPFVALVADNIVDLHLVGAGCGSQCFPLYTYAPDGTNRRDNIPDWALARFRDHYHSQKITKREIFDYVYAILHHPDYRARFAENLKRELPRIPLAPDFSTFCQAGAQLARLHLDYEQLEPYPLEFVESLAHPLSYLVKDKMSLSKDKTSLTVNPSLTLAGIPPEASEYRLGNRSALEWVVDQYQVSEDPRSGIHSDPNRPDDPQYIVRIVGQVIRVSLETVALVRSLPPWQ